MADKLRKVTRKQLLDQMAEAGDQRDLYEVTRVERELNKRFPGWEDMPNPVVHRKVTVLENHRLARDYPSICSDNLEWVLQPQTPLGDPVSLDELAPEATEADYRSPNPTGRWTITIEFEPEE